MEDNGLICAYILDRAGGGKRIGWPEIKQWTPEQGLLWVHINYIEANAQQWLSDESKLPATIVENLLVEETRPRSLAHENGLLVLLRGVNTNPGANPEDMVSIRVWLQHDLIVTSRHRRLLSINDIREDIDAGRAPNSCGDFLVRLIDRLADRIGTVVDKLDEDIEWVEERTHRNGNADIRHRLSELRRETARIRRYLAPQRDALDRLYRQPTALLNDQEATAMREHSDRITRYLEDLDLIRERALVVQEEHLNQLAHEQNRRMYVLSVVAAVFLPLSFLTGLLGMNVGGIPGTENPYAFLESIAAMVLLGIVLLIFFRWKRWI